MTKPNDDLRTNDNQARELVQEITDALQRLDRELHIRLIADRENVQPLIARADAYLATPAGSTDDNAALYQQLLDMLGAKDHSDAARIIAEHHAREIAGSTDVDEPYRRYAQIAGSTERPSDGYPVVTEAMVDRFLSWRLPSSFSPDNHIAFDREGVKHPSHWPTGTNLLTADEARAMLEYVLTDMSPQAQLQRVMHEAFREDDVETAALALEQRDRKNFDDGKAYARKLILDGLREGGPCMVISLPDPSSDTIQWTVLSNPPATTTAPGEGSVSDEDVCNAIEAYVEATAGRSKYNSRGLRAALESFANRRMEGSHE